MISAPPFLPRSALTRTLAILLAGGQGSRLHELTDRETKAALPLFATGKGPIRLVDFTLANVVRSGLSQMLALIQYRPPTLQAHLQGHWASLFPQGKLVLRDGATVRAPHGYGGTADAVAANVDLINALAPDEVIVLPGDHIYQMDYTAMIAAHRAARAAVTLAVHHVHHQGANTFGLIDAAPNGRITGVTLGPHTPDDVPDLSAQIWAGMGVYVFDWPWLRAQLAPERTTQDFAQDILPHAIATGVAQAYHLPTVAQQQAPFWRDIDTLDTLRTTLLELRAQHAACPLPTLPGPLFAPMAPSDNRLSLADSVVLPGARVAPGARLCRAIIAPGTHVPADLVVGEDPDEDARWFRITSAGTTLVTNAMLARRAGRALVGLRGPLHTAFPPRLTA